MSTTSDSAAEASLTSPTPSSPATSESGGAVQSSATSADLPPSPSKATVALPVAERKTQALKLKDEGNAKFLKGDFEAAKLSYGEAIALDPTSAVFWSNRAACELKLEQHGLAIEDATKAISLDPTFAKAYYRRASAHLSILDPKAALPDLRKVSQLEPRNATVRAQLDATTKLLRRIQFEKAIAKSEGPKSWQTAVQHLREGTGGTTIKEDYEGPRLEEGQEAPEGADPYTTGPYLGAITQTFVDEMITWFKDGKRLPLRYVWQILLGAHRAFMQEGSMVEYNIPEGQTIDVIGDTHGQFYDFIHMLTLTGKPSPTHALLFNGDAVDRGSWSVEILLTILAYKWLYPKTCFFNRGNHETHSMNQVYGFEGECKAKFGGDFTYKCMTELFNSLPLSTLITAPKEPLKGDQLPKTASLAQREPILSPEGRKRFFVVHGGLFSKDGVTLDDIRAIDRHRIGQPGNEGLMSEMLWADPQTADGRGPSKRGVGLGFGGDVCKAWCKLNGITAVLRSHEVRQEGYSEEHDGYTVTLFSAPRYCDSTDNRAAFARIDDQGTIKYTQFDAQPHPNMKPMAYASGAMGGMIG